MLRAVIGGNFSLSHDSDAFFHAHRERCILPAQSARLRSHIRASAHDRAHVCARTRSCIQTSYAATLLRQQRLGRNLLDAQNYDARQRWEEWHCAWAHASSVKANITSCQSNESRAAAGS
jgi:hypothetical protein